MPWLVLVSCLGVSPELERGERYFEQFKYAEARAALGRAKAAGGLDRKELLKVLELSGVAAGQLRQSAAAEASFRELLVLDPSYQLAADYAPRVTTPFLAARGWIGSHGAVEAVPEVKAVTGQVESLGLRVTSDPLGLVRQVRLHVEEEGRWRVEEGEAAAQVVVGKPEVRWWGELVGERGIQLFLLGTAEAPRLEVAPRAVVLTPPPPPPEVQAVEPKGLRWARPVAYVAVGLGAVAAGVGAYFGVRSSADFSKLDSATKDSSGRVIGLTEKDAYALQASGKQSATVGNVLFVSGAALGVAGIGLWAVGGEVKVAPAPGGVSIAGRF